MPIILNNYVIFNRIYIRSLEVKFERRAAILEGLPGTAATCLRCLTHPPPLFWGRGELRKLKRSVGSGVGKCHVTRPLVCFLFRNL
jgi:hypothetical protein